MADHAAVGFDDAVADREAEARALADRLGGEERLEQFRLVFRQDAGPVVLHLEPDLPAGVEDADQNPPLRTARRFDRLLRVDHEIQRDLFDLGEVRIDLARRRELDVERDRRVVEIAPPQLDDLADDLAEVDEGGRPRLLAAEARQIADDLAGPAALRLDERDLLERLRRQAAMPLEQLRGAEDRLQRVVQLVGDAGDQDADRREALLPHHLALQRLQHLSNLALLLDLAIERGMRFAQVRRHRNERFLEL